MSNPMYRICTAAFAIALWHAPLVDAAETPIPTQMFSVEVTGAGRPMILIPGLACAGSVWNDAVAHFKQKYECHVLTLAGFAGQPAVEGPFLERVRDNVSTYITDKKLDRPIIVGHSLGGFLAFSIAAAVPEKVGPIIAVDGLPFFPAIRDAAATPESAQKFADAFRTRLSGQSAEEFAELNRKFLEGMITDLNNVETVAASSNKSDPKVVGQALYDLMTTDLRPKVSAIQTPILLMCASSSIADPEQRRKVEENYRLQIEPIPKHKIVFAPKARHFIHLDEPDFFIKEAEIFLKDAGAGGTGG